MPAPIIIRNPVLLLQELNPTTFAEVGTPIDVSDDVSAVSIDPSVAIDTVAVFTGKTTIADDPEFGCSLTFVVNPDTSTNWAGLVGKFVEMRVYDRGPAATGALYRKFRSEVLMNPAIAGSTDVNDRTRGFDLDFPVYTTPEIATQA